MVLFPFALIWLIVVIVWIVRNEQNREEGEPRVWARWRKPPRDPRRGGPDRTGGRRGSSRASRDVTRDQS
jgi:hypothetical protein